MCGDERSRIIKPVLNLCQSLPGLSPRTSRLAVSLTGALESGGGTGQVAMAVPLFTSCKVKQRAERSEWGWGEGAVRGLRLKGQCQGLGICGPSTCRALPLLLVNYESNKIA